MMLTCASGHQWAPSANGQAAVCPQCGQAPLALPTAASLSAAGPPLDPESTLEPTEDPPLPADCPAVPGYEIQGVLGHGGMGIVYRAWDQRLKRPVALKMIRGDANPSPDQLRRFRAEAEAVARLQHANVVQIYEVGEVHGRPYLALEYVDGPSLARRLGGAPLPSRQAAAIAVTLARAVQAAHDQGVIHRDLKPANVLLTSKGMPKVTDFGLAKLLGVEEGQTQSGAIIGTPSYMAPEQALGKVREIGPAADVYALGAILYEMLTGRPPFRADTALNTVYQVAVEDPLPPRRLQSKVPLDLETICLKSLQKDPRKRYASASALADDLRHFLGGRPVTARPTPAWERAWKWARRHPAAAALLTVSVAAALVMVVGALYFTNELRLEKNRAVEEKVRAERGEKAAAEQRLRAEGEETRARSGEAVARTSLEEARRALYTGQIWRVDALWRQDPLQARRFLHDAICPPDRRDFAWHLYERVCACQIASVGGAGTTVVAVTADGKRAALGEMNGTVRVWDLPAARELHALHGHTGPVLAVAFSRDGRTLASGGDDRTIKLWNPADGKDLATLKNHASSVRTLAFTPDGASLASCGCLLDPGEKNSDNSMKQGEVFVWDVATGQGTLAFKHPVGLVRLAVSPNGKTLAVGTTNTAQLFLIDAIDKQKAAGPFQIRNAGWIQALAFSPDGKLLAIGKADHHVHLWDVAAQHEVQDIPGHRAGLESVAFSPDGKLLASGSQDGVIKLWDVEFPRDRVLERTTLHAHDRGVCFLGFVAGTTLASGGPDGGARLWRLPDHLERDSWDGDGKGFHAAAFSADGKTVAVGGRSAAVTLRGVATGRPVKTLTGYAGPVVQVALAPDGGSLSALSFVLDARGDHIVAWEANARTLPNGEARGSLRQPTGDYLGLALAPDGRTVAAGQEDGTVVLWDADGRQRSELRGPGGAVTAVAFAGDGRSLAAATENGVVRVWDAAAGTERGTFKTHAARVFAVTLNADGGLVAAAGVEQVRDDVVSDPSVKVWDVFSGRPRVALQPQPDLFEAMAFTPDSRMLAAGGHDSTVKLWDLTSGHLRTVLGGHSHRITSLAFAPDGKVLVSTSGALQEGHWIKYGEVKLWDATERPPRPR
jgi:WD40 repeat protein